MIRISRHAASALRSIALCAAAATVTACSTVMPAKQASVYENEAFDTRNSFSREFVASPADTCNAARRALLSQGYIVQSSQEDQMDARKRFQPESETHLLIEFHVVCSPVARGQPTSVAFVSAVQERYQVKKNPMSASVGVSPLGSISLPVATATDSLVKTGSETIPPGRFYERFFDLVEQILAEQKGLDESIPAIAPAEPRPPAATKQVDGNLSPTSGRPAERPAAAVPVSLPVQR
jgi:hypothetical protein